MPVRRRVPTAPREFRPPMPPALRSFNGADWGAPPRDGDGRGWEVAYRNAYARWQAACDEWWNQFGHLPADPSSTPRGDEPFCGEFNEHECGGAQCRRRVPTGRNARQSPQ